MALLFQINDLVIVNAPPGTSEDPPPSGLYQIVGAGDGVDTVEVSAVAPTNTDVITIKRSWVTAEYAAL
jgi:hypothetical protein